MYIVRLSFNLTSPGHHLRILKYAALKAWLVKLCRAGSTILHHPQSIFSFSATYFKHSFATRGACKLDGIKNQNKRCEDVNVRTIHLNCHTNSTSQARRISSEDLNEKIPHQGPSVMSLTYCRNRVSIFITVSPPSSLSTSIIFDRVSLHNLAVVQALHSPSLPFPFLSSAIPRFSSSGKHHRIVSHPAGKNKSRALIPAARSSSRESHLI